MDAYDGRKLNGFVYVSKTPPTSEKAPSARYLGVLVKGRLIRTRCNKRLQLDRNNSAFRVLGARQAGLKDEYVERLAKFDTYKAPPGKDINLCLSISLQQCNCSFI